MVLSSSKKPANSKDVRTPEGNRKQNKPRERGAGCLVLFALPFAAVGVVMTTLLVVKLVQHRKMQSWEVVPATILSAELESHTSDGGTTYKAVASYKYDFRGTTYYGERVGLHGGSDNVGKFQRRVSAELKRHVRSKEPFPARVDPTSPEDSILYTDLRLGIVAMFSAFGLIFGSVGFGLMISGLMAGGEQKVEKSQRLAKPDAPWEWGAGWKEGRIKSSGKAKMWVLVVLGLFWNVLGLSLLATVWKQIFDSGTWLGLLFLLIPGVGILIGWMALRAVIRHRKFGVSTFEMAAVPGVIGGRLAGAIVTNRHLEVEGGFVQRLICEETVAERRGGESSTRTRALWEDERVLTHELLGADLSRSAVPVLFKVPFDLPASEPGGSRKIEWKLQMDAAVPGVDYHAEFKVPVFKTAESDEGFVLDESPIEHLCLPGTLDEKLRRAGAKVQDLGDSLEIAFPMLLQRGAFFGMAFFTALWIGFTVLMAKLGAPWFFPLVFGLFGGLLVMILVSMIFSNKRLVLRSTELVSSGGILGREKRFPYSGLAKVETYCGMRSGSRVYHSVRVKDKQGRSASLTPDIRPASTAEALLVEIESRMAADEAR